jgi:hypothetical protein
VVVQVEAYARACLDQLGGPLGQDVAVLADRVFVEEAFAVGAAVVEAAGQHLVCVDFLDQVGQQVVYDGSGAGTGFGLDRLEVPILGESRIGDVVNPEVAAIRGDDVRFGNLHDEIGCADVPFLVARKDGGRRQIGGIAARRTGVRPRGNRRDLGVGERRVVLELLDADVALDVPGRHDAVHDAGLDGARPRPHVLVGHERHRRVGPGPMTRLTRPLNDRRDVPGVGDGRGRRGRLRCLIVLAEDGRVRDDNREHKRSEPAGRGRRVHRLILRGEGGAADSGIREPWGPP